uniref:2Fe-2S ferredoxin 8b10 n=1 Tax=Blastocystis sp. subtype 1 (strain ATCC 50177 / NandII) TaxID=478820 RepID=I3WER4_BLAHN|nr:2Fe-2S ferredoxin 8b10 [Blastocystis sp. ATCC 50177/Nand II]
MAFLLRSVPLLTKRTCYPVFTRQFGVEFKLHSVADEDTIDVEADKGLTLLDVCQNEGVDVTAVCGGGGSCGSCNVILPQDLFDALPPAKEQEAELLNTVVFGRKPTSRLACCVKISEKFAGKTIEVPLPL